jgi:hypothetical protein
MQINLLGITNVDFDVRGQRLVTFSVSVRYWKKKMGVEWYSTSAIYKFQESL